MDDPRPSMQNNNSLLSARQTQPDHQHPAPRSHVPSLSKSVCGEASRYKAVPRPLDRRTVSRMRPTTRLTSPEEVGGLTYLLQIRWSFSPEDSLIPTEDC